MHTEAAAFCLAGQQGSAGQRLGAAQPCLQRGAAQHSHVCSVAQHSTAMSAAWRSAALRASLTSVGVASSLVGCPQHCSIQRVGPQNLGEAPPVGLERHRLLAPAGGQGARQKAQSWCFWLSLCAASAARKHCRCIARQAGQQGSRAAGQQGSRAAGQQPIMPSQQQQQQQQQQMRTTCTSARSSRARSGSPCAAPWPPRTVSPP
jgi:hypothetical protein